MASLGQPAYRAKQLRDGVMQASRRLNSLHSGGPGLCSLHPAAAWRAWLAPPAAWPVCACGGPVLQAQCARTAPARLLKPHCWRPCCAAGRAQRARHHDPFQGPAGAAGRAGGCCRLPAVAAQGCTAAAACRLGACASESKPCQASGAWALPRRAGVLLPTCLFCSLLAASPARACARAAPCCITRWRRRTAPASSCCSWQTAGWWRRCGGRPRSPLPCSWRRHGRPRAAAGAGAGCAALGAEAGWSPRHGGALGFLPRLRVHREL